MNAEKRIQVIFRHLYSKFDNCHAVSVSPSLTKAVCFGNVEVEHPDPECEVYFKTLLTPDAVAFVSQLVMTFDSRVDEILNDRKVRKLQLDVSNRRPDFRTETQHIRESGWKVRPLPRRLECRNVDLGDVAPCNTEHFMAALQSAAQGIQTDFDDGHCPVWSNQLKGLYNVYMAVHNKLTSVPAIHNAPVLMLRPRAWNMKENNMMVNGKVVPGPLFDFGLLMYHNARKLIQAESGPFFYLPKMEGYLEARLWNDIFVWTQEQLGIPIGTIKACVLIENILASFEMDEILYELRDHSAGLNCGIWDYSASFVNKFGHQPEFVLPDRNKYVSMDRHFLKSYMDLVIQTCHRREALATGGMAALLLLDSHGRERQDIIENVCRAKLKEIMAGADGFMVYDLGLVQPTQALFQEFAPSRNQIAVKRSDVKVTAKDLLLMPPGGVTLNGLKHNIGVGILFIYSWLRGRGHYFYKGAVEDSATAEISRSQVWQWIRHQAKLEDGPKSVINRKLVQDLIHDFTQETVLGSSSQYGLDQERQHLLQAARIFEEIVTKRDFPEFITTYLYDEHAVRNAHGM